MRHKTLTVALIALLAGCATSQDRAQALETALSQTSIVTILGTRALARELAFHCDEVSLNEALESQIDALRVSRAQEFDAVTFETGSPELAAASRSFEAKYNVSFPLDRTRRRDWDQSMCPGALRETGWNTLMGLMLQRA